MERGELCKKQAPLLFKCFLKEVMIKFEKNIVSANKALGRFIAHFEGAQLRTNKDMTSFTASDAVNECVTFTFHEGKVKVAVVNLDLLRSSGFRFGDTLPGFDDWLLQQ